MIVNMLLPSLLLLWAGVVIGGSLIAAPAKFTVEGLPLATALEVGRAQFRWLGMAEFIFCAGVILIALLARQKSLVWCAPATVILALQWFVLMPALNERTSRIIAGDPVTDSYLHLAYVAAEIAKCMLLVVAAIMVTLDKAASTG